MNPDFSALLLKTSDFIAAHRHERPDAVALVLANQGEKLGFDKEASAFIVRQLKVGKNSPQKFRSGLRFQPSSIPLACR